MGPTNYWLACRKDQNPSDGLTLDHFLLVLHCPTGNISSSTSEATSSDQRLQAISGRSQLPDNSGIQSQRTVFRLHSLTWSKTPPVVSRLPSLPRRCSVILNNRWPADQWSTSEIPSPTPMQLSFLTKQCRLNPFFLIRCWTLGPKWHHSTTNHHPHCCITFNRNHHTSS